MFSACFIYLYKTILNKEKKAYDRFCSKRQKPKIEYT